MATIKQNNSVEALRKEMVRAMQRRSLRAKTEWMMAFYTGRTTSHWDILKERHVFDQSELKKLFNRWGQHRGASKAVHTIDANGEAFEYIVVKRIKEGAWIPSNEGSGNQLHDEVECWKKFSSLPEADYLCPCLRSYETKSDHNNPRSEAALDNIVVIAQKAIQCGVLADMCRLAYQMNEDGGYRNTETPMERKRNMMTFANSQRWRDVEYNGGNSGVIFDYAANRYKAVFVDYAL